MRTVAKPQNRSATVGAIRWMAWRSSFRLHSGGGIKRYGRKGGHAKLGRNHGRDRAGPAGGDLDRAVFADAPHHAESGKDRVGLKRPRGTDPDARADSAGRHATESIDDGKRRGAYRVPGTRAGPES